MRPSLRPVNLNLKPEKPNLRPDRPGEESRILTKNGNGRMKLQGTGKITSKEEIREIAQKVWNLGQ